MPTCTPLSKRPNVYSPLRADGTEIRALLVAPGDTLDPLFCSLQHLDMNLITPYKALSYTWGDASKTTLISIDGQPFPVTTNLASALTALRSQTGTVIVWADAVCINQENIPEVNLMVSRMRLIYECAEEVLVWLGDAQPNDKRAVSFIEDLHSSWQSDEWWGEASQNHTTEQSIAGIHNMLTREYWSRTWVVQETMFNNSITVFCGSTRFPWSHLHFSKIIDQRGVDIAKLPGMVSQGVQRLMRNSISSNPGDPGFGGIPTAFDLLRTLIWYRQLAATNPKDKVYAFIGLLGSECPPYNIDYGLTVQEAFINTAKYIISATKSLDIIAVTRTALEMQDLPTWAPDWRRQPDSTSVNLSRLRAEDPLFCASGSRGAHFSFHDNDRVLSVEGFQVATLQYLGIPCRVEDMTQNLSHRQAAFAAFVEWYQLLVQLKGTDEERVIEFFRVLSCDYACSSNVSGAVNQSPRAVAQSAISAIASTAHDMGMLDVVPRPLLHMLPPEKAPKRDENAGVASTVFIQDRRFCVSSGGMIGLVPACAETTDILCIIHGCRHPLVLRRQGDCFKVIGEAFVHGLMYGEWLEHEANATCLRNFDLV